MARPKGTQKIVTRRAFAASVSSTLGSDSNGQAIDRDDIQWPKSVLLSLDGSTGLGTASDSLTFSVQDAADDGTGSPDTWADTGDTLTISNGTKRNTTELDLDGYRRHVRLQLDVSDSGQSLGSNTTVYGEYTFADMKVVPQS